MFPDTLLSALGAWQRGWHEDQSRRLELSRDLEAAAQLLPLKYKAVSEPCFRKRFLHPGELVDIVLKDSKDEGIVSWTTKKEFAKRFKGLKKCGALSAAIFRATPSEHEVVVNVNALWQDPEFQRAVAEYEAAGKPHADALMNFRDTQGEVILKTALRGTDIVAFSGVSSPFDELCDSALIPEDQRDAVFKKLVDAGIYFGELRYVSEEGSQAVIGRIIDRMSQLINRHKMPHVNKDST